MSSMRRRIIRALLLGVVLAVVAAGIGGWWLRGQMRASLPQIDGTLKLAGLAALPDAAAVEAVALASPRTRIIDASTAHRTSKDFVYGLPELTGTQRGAISGARLVANPGCWPTGFLLAVRVDAKGLEILSRSPSVVAVEPNEPEPAGDS